MVEKQYTLTVVTNVRPPSLIKIFISPPTLSNKWSRRLTKGLRHLRQPYLAMGPSHGCNFGSHFGGADQSRYIEQPDSSQWLECYHPIANLGAPVRFNMLIDHRAAEMRKPR